MEPQPELYVAGTLVVDALVVDAPQSYVHQSQSHAAMGTSCPFRAPPIHAHARTDLPPTRQVALLCFASSPWKQGLRRHPRRRDDDHSQPAPSARMAFALCRRSDSRDRYHGRPRQCGARPRCASSVCPQQGLSTRFVSGFCSEIVLPHGFCLRSSSWPYTRHE